MKNFVATGPGKQVDDELLRPTLQGFEVPGSGGGPPPWPLMSQLYVAFLGGPIAAVWIAWLNAGRLELSSKRRLAILGIGVPATALAAATCGYVLAGGEGPDRDTLTRIGMRAFALMVSGLFYLMQKSQDRLYQVNIRPLLYARSFIPGLIIVIVSAVGFLLLTLAAKGYFLRLEGA